MECIEFPPQHQGSAYEAAMAATRTMRAQGYKVRLTRRMGADGRPTWLVWYHEPEGADPQALVKARRAAIHRIK